MIYICTPMWNSVFRRILVLSLVVVIGTSCSRFRMIQKSEDWKVKYEAAFEYYEKEDYYRSILLFEEIMPVIRAMKEGEKAQFYYAYCHYYQKSYLLSSHYFETFAQTYSRSEYAEEAHYMAALSLFNQSPYYNLDQSSTTEAVDALQAHVNRYPNSVYFEQASAMINALQYKLEQKNYELSKQFFRLRRYEAAVLSIDNFNKDFPDSDLNEELNYIKVLAQHNYAEQSIAARQKERYQKMIELYLEFIEDYPESEYIRDAERLYASSMNALSGLQAIN